MIVCFSFAFHKCDMCKLASHCRLACKTGEKKETINSSQSIGPMPSELSNGQKIKFTCNAIQMNLEIQTLVCNDGINMSLCYWSPF